LPASFCKNITHLARYTFLLLCGAGLSLAYLMHKLRRWITGGVVIKEKELLMWRRPVGVFYEKTD